MVSRAVYFLWLYYAVAALAAGLGALACHGLDCARNPWPQQALLSLSLLGLAAALLAPLRRAEPRLFRLPRLGELLALPLWSVPVSWSFAVAAFALLPKAEGNVNLPRGLSSGELLPFWLTLAVVVPLLEEILFRGWLLRAFRHNDGLTAAVWLSALIFGLAHVLPAVALFAFGGGLIWGRYVARGGSLWATVFAHLVTNSMPFVLVSANGPPSPQNPGEIGLAPWTALPALALGILLMFLFFRRTPLPPEAAPRGAERSIPLFLTLLGLGVAGVLTLGTSF